MAFIFPKDKTKALILTIVVGVLSLLFFFMPISMVLMHNYQKDNYVQTTATITNVQKSSNNQNYIVTYTFAVDGKEYSISKTLLISKQKGEKENICYNPKNPKQAVDASNLKNYMNVSDTLTNPSFLLSFGIIFFLFILFLLNFFHIKKEERKKHLP